MYLLCGSVCGASCAEAAEILVLQLVLLLPWVPALLLVCLIAGVRVSCVQAAEILVLLLVLLLSWLPLLLHGSA